MANLDRSNSHSTIESVDSQSDSPRMARSVSNSTIESESDSPREKKRASPRERRASSREASESPTSPPLDLEDLVVHPLFKGDFKEHIGQTYTRTGIQKQHKHDLCNYIVISYIYEEHGHIIKKTAYKLTKFDINQDKNLDEIFKICKKNTMDEVNFQEKARKLMEQEKERQRMEQEDKRMEEPTPIFSVPKIYRFNCYINKFYDIIALIEMDKIIPNETKPSKLEIREFIVPANEFLKSNGIHHNDLVVSRHLNSSNFHDVFGNVEFTINEGNVIKDADGKWWIIDFGSAADVVRKSRGGKSKKSYLRKSKKSKRVKTRTRRKIC